MNDLVEQIVHKIEYKGAAYTRILAGIGYLFTELVIFGDVLDLPSVDISRVDKDINIEMKLVLLEIKLPYQDSNKYKWLHYYIQDMVLYAVNIVVDLYVAIQTKKWNLWKMNVKINNSVSS